MSAKRIFSAIALSSASCLALATPAKAVTGNSPIIQGFQTAGSICRINFRYTVRGSENDFNQNDLFHEVLTDAGGGNITTPRLLSVLTSGSRSRATQIDLSSAGLRGGGSAPYVAIYDTDAAGTREQLVGRTQVNLAQMASVQGECAAVARKFGYAANTAPVTEAGADQSVTAGSQVTLDGSGTSDPDGDTLTYSWTQVSGPSAAISNANQAVAQVQTQAGPSATYVFELTATDPSGASNSDRVTIQTLGQGGVVVPVNSPPVADAGPDATIASGATLVRLDATGSSDPDGDTLSFRWTQVSGSNVTLRNSNLANATFSAPSGIAAQQQQLVFQVTVTDPGGLSATDTVTYTVSGNRAPVADAGNDRTVEGGTAVTLDATSSSDPDGDTLSYSFRQTGGPNVALSGANTATPSFTAPLGTPTAQTLTFEVTVDDGQETATDSVVVTVSPNSAPNADAGADIGPVDEGNLVTLNGSASSDPDGDSVSYSWTQISGPSVVLAGRTSAQASFTAPGVNGTQDLVFELTVDDGQRQSTDRVRVRVRERGSITIVQRVIGDDVTVGYSSNVPGLAAQLTTSNGIGKITATDVSAGNYSFSVDDLRVQGYALTALACSDTDSIVTSGGGSGSVAIALSPGESLTCTVTLADTRSAAQRAIGEFIGGRNALLLANQPNFQRRLDRVKGRQAAGGSAMIGQVPVPGSGNLPAQVNVTRSSKSISTSLAMAQSALGGPAGGGKLDIWFEGSLADVSLGNNRGEFALGYFGIDYLVQDGLLIGALAQFDRFDSDDALATGQSEGDGWMVGPYLTARLAPRFYIDARIAFGGSDNSVSPLGTYVDGYETDRMLASASAIGDLDLGDGFTLWPELGLRYIREDIDGYVDTLGVAVPDAVIDQGELALSPRLDYRSISQQGWVFAPYAEFEGVLTFGADAFSAVDNGLRGRGALGLDIASPGGLRFGVSGFYDGIGEDGFEAAGATATVSLSF